MIPEELLESTGHLFGHVALAWAFAWVLRTLKGLLCKKDLREFGLQGAEIDTQMPSGHGKKGILFLVG